MRGEHLETGYIYDRQKHAEALRTLDKAKEMEIERERLVQQGVLRKTIIKDGLKTTRIRYERV